MVNNSIIPLNIFFGRNDIQDIKLSPDGKWISCVRLEGNVQSITLYDNNLKKAHVLYKTDRASIREICWARNNTHILITRDNYGDEKWFICSLNIYTNLLIDICNTETAVSSVVKLSNNRNNFALVECCFLDSSKQEYYEVDILTGNKKSLFKGDSLSESFFDANFNLRATQKYNSDGSFTLFDSDNKELLMIGFDNAYMSRVVGIDEDKASLIVITALSNNYSSIYSIDLYNGDINLLSKPHDSDIDCLFLNPISNSVEAYATCISKKIWHTINAALTNDLTFLNKKFKGEYNILCRDDSNELWIVSHTTTKQPNRFFLYYRSHEKLTLLYDNNKFKKYIINERKALIIKSRDNLDLISYISLPSHKKVEGKLPLVVFVHGGPWARNVYGYNDIHAWLSNRGYIVISTNYRGSTGFGKLFLNQGNLQWGEKIQEDILDTVLWAVDKKIADENKIAIIGASFGGYSALASLCFHPKVYSCAIDIAGPTNLFNLLNSIPKNLYALYPNLSKRIGNPKTNEGKRILKKHSPFYHTNKITKPLLIIHGENDARVNVIESDSIVELLLANKNLITYATFLNEGHEIRNAKNRLDMYEMIDCFLAHHLKDEMVKPRMNIDNPNLIIKHDYNQIIS